VGAANRTIGLSPKTPKTICARAKPLDVKVEGHDIGKVSVGQPMRNKFEAF
jgi:hypothetical protein